MDQRFSDVAAQDKAVFHVKVPVKSSGTEGQQCQVQQQLNMHFNIEKGDNFGQVMSQMAQMEQLQNTLDFQKIGEVMQFIDSMTKCDKVKREARDQEDYDEKPQVKADQGWKSGAQ